MYQVSNARLLSYSLLPPTDPFNFTCLNQVICNSGCPLRQITPKTQWIQPLSALLISQKAAGDWTTNLLKSPRCHSERKTGKPCWVQIVNWFFSLVSRPNGNTKFQWSPLTTFTAIQLTVKQDSLHSFVGRGNSQDNTGTAVDSVNKLWVVNFWLTTQHKWLWTVTPSSSFKQFNRIFLQSVSNWKCVLRMRLKRCSELANVCKARGKTVWDGRVGLSTAKLRCPTAVSSCHLQQLMSAKRGVRLFETVGLSTAKLRCPTAVSSCHLQQLMLSTQHRQVRQHLSRSRLTGRRQRSKLWVVGRICR